MHPDDLQLASFFCTCSKYSMHLQVLPIVLAVWGASYPGIVLWMLSQRGRSHRQSTPPYRHGEPSQGRHEHVVVGLRDIDGGSERGGGPCKVFQPE